MEQRLGDDGPLQTKQFFPVSFFEVEHPSFTNRFASPLQKSAAHQPFLKKNREPCLKIKKTKKKDSQKSFKETSQSLKSRIQSTLGFSNRA